MPPTYRTEIYSEAAHKWVAIYDGKESAQATRQYELNADAKKTRILRFAVDKRGHIRPTVIRDSTVEQVKVTAIASGMADSESRLVREDDGNVLRSGRR